MHRGYIKSFVAEVVIPPARIARFGSADGQIALAASAVDVVVGATDPTVTSQIGQDADITLTGVALVTLGASVARGTRCVSDAAGCAVPAVPAVGVNVNTVGYPLVSGVAGDVVEFVIMPAPVQG